MRRFSRAVSIALLGAFALLAACAPEEGGGGPPANTAPTAVIAAVPTSGNVPLTVAFDGTGSSDPESGALTYAWDFGNGQSGSGATASTTYTSAGPFTATLTVTDPGGLPDSATVTINVSGTGDGDGDGHLPPFDCDDSDAGIHPGADDPAGDGIDQDCDGIDGSLDAVFVSAGSGEDNTSCGLLIGKECATIGYGITRAVEEGRSEVYVAGGSYPGFVVTAGIDVVGGYRQDFQPAGQPGGGSTRTVVAATIFGWDSRVAVFATNINVPTRIAHLEVWAADGTRSASSSAIEVRDSNSALMFESLWVAGGTAADGTNGSAGTAAPQSPAASGSAGGNGLEPGGWCNATASGAGGAGAAGGLAGGSGSGGTGGRGGPVDTFCTPGMFDNDYNAQHGFRGLDGGGGAKGGPGGVPSGSCSGPGVDGKRGEDGRNGSDGVDGRGGAPGGPGEDGTVGSHGQGGGGGGGGAGSDCWTEAAGAGGGGGGAGGLRAPGPGYGGTAGQDSIAIKLVAASPTFIDVYVKLGAGGKGGNGGAGKPGQPGGQGGLGGAPVDIGIGVNGGAAGDGGAGGRGGASGAGGGGGGGSAIGVDSNMPASFSGITCEGGSGGAGGNGGSGAPWGKGASGELICIRSPWVGN